MPPGQRVELVRAVYAQAAGGDLVGMAGPTGVFPRRPRPDPGMREWLSSFASYEVEIERAVEVGASVVLLTIERGRSLRGGVPVEQKGAVVWTFDGEAVVRIETYLDRRLALKALSLPG